MIQENAHLAHPTVLLEFIIFEPLTITLNNKQLLL